MGKKKREHEAEAQNDPSLANGVSQSIEKKRKKKKKSKEQQKDVESAASEMTTVSIAVPGSIIDNAQSLELATRLAGQVSRAATNFRIDEGLLPPLSPIICVSTNGVQTERYHTEKPRWRFVARHVDVGLSKNVVVDEVVEAGKRVTVARVKLCPVFLIRTSTHVLIKEA